MAVKPQTDMYAIVLLERKIFCGLIILHIVCVTALLTGMLFAYLYMKMPDRVIVMARDNSIYLGNSAPLESRRVIEDAAMRATFALLSRRYDIQNEKAINFAFTKRGQGQAKGYLNDTQETFEKRKIFQEVETATVETAILQGQHHALVKGTLLKRGIYFGHPYQQKRDFALMMRLEKSESDTELPYKVAGMRYYEEEQEVVEVPKDAPEK